LLIIFLELLTGFTPNLYLKHIAVGNILSCMNSLPTLEHEIELWKKGYIVIGIDEVGRGAFAGPLFVGGVVFPPTTNNPSTSRRNSERIKYLESLGINDSKKLKPNERKTLAKVIQKESLAYHISKINVARINRIGIGKATFCAMRDVVNNLRETLRTVHLEPPHPVPLPRGRGNMGEGDKIFVLVDGFYVKYLNGIGLKNQRGIVHGDEISLSIAAASIIAKVARDNHMRKLSAKYKVYGWGRNKGYGTAEHRKALLKFGKTKFHRLDFIEGFV